MATAVVWSSRGGLKRGGWWPGRFEGEELSLSLSLFPPPPYNQPANVFTVERAILGAPFLIPGPTHTRVHARLLNLETLYTHGPEPTAFYKRIKVKWRMHTPPQFASLHVPARGRFLIPRDQPPSSPSIVVKMNFRGLMEGEEAGRKHRGWVLSSGGGCNFGASRRCFELVFRAGDGRRWRDGGMVIFARVWEMNDTMHRIFFYRRLYPFYWNFRVDGIFIRFNHLWWRVRMKI